jgi:hypothetical protein
MNPSPSSRFRAAPAVHSRRFGAELVVLDLERGEYFALDEMGARVWDELAEGRPLAAVVGAIAHEYEVNADRLWSDLSTFSDELVAKGLLLALG